MSVIMAEIVTKVQGAFTHHTVFIRHYLIFEYVYVEVRGRFILLSLTFEMVHQSTHVEGV